MTSPRPKLTRLFAASRAALCTLLAILTTALLAFLPAYFQSIPALHSSRTATSKGPNLRWLWTPRAQWPTNPESIVRTGTIGYRQATAVSFPDSGRWHKQSTTAIGLPFALAINREDSYQPFTRPFSGAPSFISLADDGRSLFLKPATTNQTLIPLTPYLPGLLADLFLLTALWYALLTAPTILQRRARRARGQCPRCGYDLQQLPTCPECGRPNTLPPPPGP